MATYPVLDENPSINGYSETALVDPTIKAPFEAGYTQTRSRFTRIPEKWTIKYEVLTAVDKNTLKAFERARLIGSESFDWTNPSDNVTYDVRFGGPGPVVYAPRENDDFWTCEFTLEQV